LKNKLRALGDAVWHCEPPEWNHDGGRLAVTTGTDTDFWQDTFYGFHRDNGHFFGTEVSGDFSAIVAFNGEYEALYDQAGLMMRVDADTWLKAGIEYSDDITNFSVVVTREGRSDWSVIGVPKVSGTQQVRLTRVGSAALVHYLGADDSWHLMRLADFAAGEKVQIGPMACSPQRTGFQVEFTGFDINDPVKNPLHGG
jgi:hypothetical protein